MLMDAESGLWGHPSLSVPLCLRRQEGEKMESGVKEYHGVGSLEDR